MTDIPLTFYYISASNSQNIPGAGVKEVSANMENINQAKSAYKILQ